MNDLEKLLKMGHGDTVYLNWFEEGGGEDAFKTLIKEHFTKEDLFGEDE